MNDPIVRQLLRAATQRFGSSEILFNHQAYHDCIYLAGYVFECALKALILAQIPQAKRRDFEKRHFRGSHAHNVDYLRELLVRRGTKLTLEVTKHLRRVDWSTELRYKAGRGDRATADAFLKSAKVVLKWVEERV